MNVKLSMSTVPYGLSSEPLKFRQLFLILLLLTNFL